MIRLQLPNLFASLLLFALAVSACQSATPAPRETLTRPQTTPTVPSSSVSPTVSSGGSASAPTLNLKGHFVFSLADGSLWLQDASTGNARVLFKPTANVYAGFPTFSPDGKQVAYMVNSFTKDGRPKNDIRIMNVDGTDERVILASDDPKITFGLPAWSPDGQEIYVTQSYLVPPSSEHYEIDRVSAKGGVLRKVLDEGSEASLSPDGRKIVFQRIDFKTFTSSLWTANLDGSGAKRIMDSGTFFVVFGARFSPDSQTIVFAASGPPNKKLPGIGFNNKINTADRPQLAEDHSCFLSVLFTCLIETAEAHGLPWDLWLVNLDGTKFERLTNVGADSPVPAWSQDGKYIAFFELTGIYVLDREKKRIYPVSSQGGYGGFDWR